MSEKLFTNEQIEFLSKNKYVKHVSEKSITYTLEFKEYFINEYFKGLLPRIIFDNAGMLYSILGERRISNAADRFKKQYKRNDGFIDTRKNHSGRPVTRNLSTEEKLKKAQEQIVFLKQENEFLKKIRCAERQVKNKHQ